MPTLPPGGLLLRVLYLSLDPYMRGRMDDAKSYAKSVDVGEVMTGESVCEVIASDRPGYAPGDIVLAHTGWRTHAAWSGPALRKLDPKQAPITTGLGVLGMPGFTAYAGFYVIGKPKAGETVVVAAASGPVGSLVGQLAKMVGRRAVGIAGGADKCRYVIEELRFDAAIDHRAADFARKARGGLPQRHRRLFRKCRRRRLAGGAAFAQYLCARAGLRLIAQYSADRPGRRTESSSRNHARDADQEPHAARLHQHRIRRRALRRFPEDRRPPASPTAASATARTSPKASRTRRLRSWACCRGRISARCWST